MIDQIFGLLLIGLGLKTPHILPPGAVKGDSTEAIVNETPEAQETGLPSEKPRRADFKGSPKPTRDYSGIEAAPSEKRGIFRPDGKFGPSGSTGARPPMGDMRREDFSKMSSAPGMEKFKEELKAKRQQAREAFAQKREEFKQRLENIKDEKKKQIVSNLDTKMTDLNTKRTQIMTDQLTKMEEILTNAQTSADELEAEGKDVATLTQAISSAHSAIAEAKTAVSAQAAKEYVPQVLSEDRLKSDVQATITQMQQDLKSVEEMMMKARQAVKTVIEELAILQGDTTQ